MADPGEDGTATVADGGESNGAAATGHVARQKPICRFYNTPNGCRSGDQCRFIHSTQTTHTNSTSDMAQKKISKPAQSSRPPATRVETAPRQNQVVSKPTPKVDPRTFQLNQIQRRFQPEQTESEGSTVFKFPMKPSDPDFPYDIEALECQLTVPSTYPNSGRPTLLIKNKDIPRGFQINIERGFDSIAAASPTTTLLSLMNQLDRQLESILAGRMADTIKIVTNKTRSQQSSAAEGSQVAIQENPVPLVEECSVVFTTQQIVAAEKARQSHVRQLEARFSRLQPFVKSSDGGSYTIPIDSPKRSAWPKALQPIRSAHLLVPQRYPLEPAEVLFDVEAPEASAVSAAFRMRAAQTPESTLTQQINYLIQHMKEMSVLPAENKQEAPSQQPHASTDAALSQSSQPQTAAVDSRDSHIRYIQRPAEWDAAPDSDSSSDEEDGSVDSATDEDIETGEDAPADQPATSAPAERGILLSLPRLELHGIELLELVSLNITVKCERCKDILDIARLRSAGEDAKMRLESCKKCAAGIAARYRADMIHANSVRAGYIDLEGAIIVDLLPSSFIATCSGCSTPSPAPGVVAVRGDSAMAVCRECHQKMSFRIVEVKFLQVSASAIRASTVSGKKKAKENLGITAGTALPKEGSCSHYRKSYRWFRFSCCGKVFACDRCHDAQSDHPNEWANRMLCGYCSREQNYRPEDCGICHASLIGRRGRGFWEGGKGTRDPRKMSRKDPRKYKRRPGTKATT
ncbi:hypothetical protein BDY17DRAFT_293739 [Neohortaea acidophila]|uniref:CHY-type domain-containing protein n=1 Tax=Neohortaea acidophila TaxID=245834 RepID=A0A6A6Q0H9_9PEZI|nr:uncharacterized protein BDY17DRAFT_293739 [Neohortaea acidophila]KAF2485504.1 hypothetical protein BDY17DRAFT_293739 [Neohortaea acidophila]